VKSPAAKKQKTAAAPKAPASDKKGKAVVAKTEPGPGDSDDEGSLEYSDDSGGAWQILPVTSSIVADIARRHPHCR
jgi:hypothetical protein